MDTNDKNSYQKVLVTGANGQLGSEIKILSNEWPGLFFTFTDIDSLDITNSGAVTSFFASNKPDSIVNSAAYTAVDKSEQEPEKAHAINVLAPAILANATKSIGSDLIHVSTDYVFDGKSWKPYSENDETSPNSIYGNTKLKGEEAVLEVGNSMVIRTSWLYSTFGNNFLKTIIKKGNELPVLNVVFDQVGCPTWANDLANAILAIIAKGKDQFKPEVFHYSNEGVCSWYDFAKEIALQSNLSCKINAILSSQYPTLAIRPPYSVMDKSKIKQTYGIEIQHWRQSLINCIERI